jgi:multicomponent Na+:H+ antiporter subunit E
MLLASILLALTWAALQGDFSLTSLVVGYLLGSGILVFLGKGGIVPSRLGAKVVHFFALAGFFLWELVLANVRVALDVVRPAHTIQPAVVAVPLDATSDGEILLLSALINLTPGSVTIDVADDRRTLYVHVMHAQDVEATRQEIKDGFERRVMQLFR